MKKKLFTGLVAVLLIISTFGKADAVTIFDNFGPPPGYKTSGAMGFAVGPISSGIVNMAAIPFTPSAAFHLNSFDIPIWNEEGTESTTMQFSLVSDSTGEPGTVPLETFSLTLGPADSKDVYTVNSLFNSLLNAGQMYWLIASSPDRVGWLYTTSDDSSGQANSYNNGISWFVHMPTEIGSQLALRMDGSPVPIPGALWLLGSGLAGLLAMRRGKK